MKLEDLKRPFSEALFLQINKQLIDTEFAPSQLSVSPENSKFITNTKYYGNYDDLDLHILTVEHSGTEDARVGVSLDIFKLMKKYSFQNALVAANSKSSDSWRYSLVTSNLSVNDKGKVTKEFSNPRRYSFILGPNQKVLTPYKQLVQSGNVSDINELSKRFSLEVVNDEFYKEIAKLYDELVGTEKIARKLKYPSSGDDSQEFAVRLIGRVIFCWFLREKKSRAGLSLIPNDILSRNASGEANYYHNVLTPLFFEVLNKPIQKRTNKFQTGNYKDIPYLNGGLFNPDDIDNYSFDKALEISAPGLVNVPDSWLHDFFDLLERFNFTVDENTSYDTDLSIDPEMLGRVFENLLARINPETGETVRKSTGSFYTPREIVEYMVDTSLSEYLASKTRIKREKIKALVSYDLFDDDGNVLSKEENILVLEALSTLTVLDPACGSGAYPIGMLQKIVFIITKLDPNAEWWLAKQLEGASPELRREFTNRSVDYVRKLGIIRQTIFGVDIQPIATEISRLRCFLTLIVDEAIDDNQENRGIRPLPNLDFKFITANSLIKLPENVQKDGLSQQGFFEDTTGLAELRQVMSEYFTAPSGDRDGIRYKFAQVQKKLFQNMLGYKDVSSDTKTFKISSWDPFEHKASEWFDPEWIFGIEDGFNIVIANPPWVFSRKGNFSDEDKSYYAKNYIGSKGKINLFGLFINRGFWLTVPDGLVTMIIPNTFLRGTVYEELRKYLAVNARILKIVDTGADVFGDVTASTVVLLIQNSEPQEFIQTCTLSKEMNEQHPGNISIAAVLQTESAIFNIGIGDETDALKEKILSRSKPLEDFIDVLISGIQTWKQNKSNLISNEKTSDLHRPLIEGKDIERFIVHYKNKYILYDKKLLNVMQDESIFQRSEKIVIQRVSGGKMPLKVAIDRDKNYCFNSLNTLICKSISNTYIAAVLNSKLTNWYYSTFFSNNSSLTVNISAKLLKQIPIPVAGSLVQHKIEEIVEEIITSRSNDQDADNAELEARINQLVYQLYNLTPEEIQIIESSTK